MGRHGSCCLGSSVVRLTFCFFGKMCKRPAEKCSCTADTCFPCLSVLSVCLSVSSPISLRSDCLHERWEVERAKTADLQDQAAAAAAGLQDTARPSPRLMPGPEAAELEAQLEAELGATKAELEASRAEAETERRGRGAAEREIERLRAQVSLETTWYNCGAGFGGQGAGGGGL